MKVKFLTPVDHDAIRYGEGETADLPAAAAKTLIDLGAAETIDAVSAKAAAKAKAEAEAAEQAEATARAEAEAAEKAAADAAAAGGNSDGNQG